MLKVIGIDFDNTLINYDEVFFNHALSLNLIGPETNKNKKDVRDKIRLLTDGEIIWQKIQAFVYGQGIAQACLNEGVETFLKTCAQQEIKVYVISHKTEYSPFDAHKINLRQVALDWMKANGFNKAQVYFESTRAQKIERIKSLKCTHFIDDLPEVFLEDGFPSGTKKILYAPGFEAPPRDDIAVAGSWKKIHEYFFN